jgi:uncharacterized protein (UPF0147 family)
MTEEHLKEIIELLERLENDENVPRSIKLKLRCIRGSLCDENKLLAIRVDESIEELDEIAEDQFVPAHVKTQIWEVVSRLEGI